MNYSAVNLPPDCINLGQGYMNFAPPRWVTEAAEGALQAVASNHYSHPKGRIRLREAIKAFYGPKLNRDLDVESEILVTSGANEGSWPFGHASPSLTPKSQVNIPSSLHSWNRETK